MKPSYRRRKQPILSATGFYNNQNGCFFQVFLPFTPLPVRKMFLPDWLEGMLRGSALLKFCIETAEIMNTPFWGLSLGDRFMPDCQFLAKCPFFNAEEVVQRRHLTAYLKETYCRGDFTRCCRYQIATTIGREHVPTLMMPDQTRWAEEILKNHSAQSGSGHSAQS